MHLRFFELLSFCTITHTPPFYTLPPLFLALTLYLQSPLTTYTPLSHTLSLPLLHSPKLRMSFINFDDIKDVATRLNLTSNRTLMNAGIKRLEDIPKISNGTFLEPAINKVKYYREVFNVIKCNVQEHVSTCIWALYPTICDCVLLLFRYNPHCTHFNDMDFMHISPLKQS